MLLQRKKRLTLVLDELATIQTSYIKWWLVLVVGA